MTTAFTPSATNHRGLAATASRFVDVPNLPWEKTKFPGVETKTLMIDKETGLLTVLLKMAPGTSLPDHEHVLIEQTYVLEGRLVDAECEVGPGQYVWRPAGSRHEAHCPDGGLMIAIFQVPNKFFDEPGRVTDLLGQDWDRAWGPALDRATREHA